MIQNLLDFGHTKFFVEGFRMSRLGGKYIDLTNEQKYYIISTLLDCLYMDLKKHESPERKKQYDDLLQETRDLVIESKHGPQMLQIMKGKQDKTK